MNYIRLNEIDKIKKFANVVSSFNSPIEIWEEGDNKVYNAKSIMSVMCLGGHNTVVDIKTTDADERARFNHEMEEFK